MGAGCRKYECHGDDFGSNICVDSFLSQGSESKEGREHAFTLCIANAYTFLIQRDK
jgi:hypothetical protein